MQSTVLIWMVAEAVVYRDAWLVVRGRDDIAALDLAEELGGRKRISHDASQKTKISSDNERCREREREVEMSASYHPGRKAALSKCTCLDASQPHDEPWMIA